MPTPTPTGGTGCTGLFCEVIPGIGDAIKDAIGFATDPLGGILKALQDSATSLAKDVMPAVASATLPDLNAEWFLGAYAISFGVAVLLAVVLVIIQAVRTASGKMAGRDLAAAIGLYFPLFLVGAMFGPLAGILVVQFVHALSSDVIGWATQGAGDGVDVIGRFVTMISSVSPATMTGGIIVSILLMLLMVIGLVLVVMLLVVQLVTLYFTGILIPLGLVWIIDPVWRSYGTTLLRVWAGILVAHPLLFFLLGVVFRFMGSSVTNSSQSPPLQAFLTFVAALVALGMALFTPTLLLKFGAVMPTGTGGTNGPTFSGNTIGSRNLHDAGDSLQRSGRQSYNSSRSGATGATGGPGAAGAAGGGSGSGTLAAAAAARSAPAAAGAGATTATAGAAASSTGVDAAIRVPLIAAAGIAAVGEKAIGAGKETANQAVAPVDDTPTIGPDRL